MNSYSIIIVTFIVAGAAIMAWGWRVMAAGNRSKQWPQAEGKIERSTEAAETEDLLPEIEFSYVVEGRQYRRRFEFPNGTMPTPELNRFYLEKYPVGGAVPVYYNPAQPDEATLEPGMARGDWLVFALGLLSVFVGLGMFIAG